MEVLSKVGAPFIDEKWWQSRRIIDSNYDHFEIKGIDVIGNCGWWPQILTAPSNRTFKVNYHFNKIESLELDEIKTIIIPCLRAERAPWAGVRDSNDFSEIIKEIEIEL